MKTNIWWNATHFSLKDNVKQHKLYGYTWKKILQYLILHIQVIHQVCCAVSCMWYRHESCSAIDNPWIESRNILYHIIINNNTFDNKLQKLKLTELQNWDKPLVYMHLNWSLTDMGWSPNVCCKYHHHLCPCLLHSHHRTRQELARRGFPSYKVR